MVDVLLTLKSFFGHRLGSASSPSRSNNTTEVSVSVGPRTLLQEQQQQQQQQILQYGRLRLFLQPDDLLADGKAPSDRVCIERGGQRAHLPGDRLRGRSRVGNRQENAQHLGGQRGSSQN